MPILCWYRTIHILDIWYFTLNTIHTTVKIPSNTTFIIIFILDITGGHIIYNFIFTDTLPTFPAKVTVFCIRAPIFKLSCGRCIRPWYKLFRIQDGKWSVYNWLCQVYQNTQKSQYFYTCVYSYIFTYCIHETTCKCYTIYTVYTILFYSYYSHIFTSHFFHIYFISYIRCTMCTRHATMFTHFGCYFVQTGLGLGITGNSTIYNTMFGIDYLCFHYFIFANTILAVPTKVALWYICTPIFMLPLGRMLGSWYVWYLLCKNVAVYAQQNAYPLHVAPKWHLHFYKKFIFCYHKKEMQVFFIQI
ncbi:p110_11L_1 [African swine fever virus]|uniref:p110_11L_1 n=1 Tax=African swine fever virus TaxID=10497 RepID=A0A6G7KU24_ASF|nr:p110_11L_1 [African swine fever virus]